MSTEKLNELLNKEWYKFTKNIKNNNHTNYNWLLNEPTPHYFNNYYRLGSYYKNNIHRIIIILSKLLSNPLWKVLIWPHIIKNTLQLIEKDYFKTLNWNNDPELKKTKITFMTKLKKLVKTHPTEIANAPISDFLNIIGYSLTTYFKHIKGHTDIYYDHKKEQNKQCSLLYDQLKTDIAKRKDKLTLLFFLATRANWIDSFENEAETFLKGFPLEINEIMASNDLASFIEPLLGIFHTRSINTILNKGPQNIIYELDNSGEIYFDLLLVEELLQNGHAITLVAKKNPCLNDITLTELKAIMNSELLNWSIPYRNLNVLKLIHNGSSMPGKTISTISEDYQSEYQKADLIILKGQGNFQTMPIGYQKQKRFHPYFYKKPILIMMGIKSKLIHFSLQQIFRKKCPRFQSLFIYFFDPNNPKTYPK